MGDNSFFFNYSPPVANGEGKGRTGKGRQNNPEPLFLKKMLEGSGALYSPQVNFPALMQNLNPSWIEARKGQVNSYQ